MIPVPLPAVVAGATQAVVLDGEGEIHTLSPTRAAPLILEHIPVVCHGPQTAARLGVRPPVMRDVLELFAFVQPARPCVPTPRGLALALDLPPPEDLETAVALLPRAASVLLTRLQALPPGEARPACRVARVMSRGGWSWGPAVLGALGETADDGGVHGLRVWQRLPEWEEITPLPCEGHQPVTPDEAEERLLTLLHEAAEPRPAQRSYARAVSAAFHPRAEPDQPTVVLAEAGTGIGKTLGYVAPASVWAERNRGTVWLSTYTRALQRQLDEELNRLYPAESERSRRVVVRKGRENYLCLLNYEEATTTLDARAGAAVALGLVARWLEHTRDGDVMGGDFPAWLNDLLAPWRPTALADRRGECLYTACTHYGKCFIERAIRRARRARLVVANHALVMVQAALGEGDDSLLPQRYVFDEGHHLFDAADSAFAAHLSGRETAELRRWLLGAEDRRLSRGRGLKARMEDLADLDDAIGAALGAVEAAARALPGPGWAARLAGGEPLGPVETFLAAVRTQVLARAPGRAGPYSLETPTHPVAEAVQAAVMPCAEALARLGEPVTALGAALARVLAQESDTLDTALRQRLDGLGRSLERRARRPLMAWQAMLAALDGQTVTDLLTDGGAEVVDWFALERAGGQERDVGLYRHFVDPMAPFAATVLAPAHGVVVTSATLRDGSGDEDADWQRAADRCGAARLSLSPHRVALASPFDYAARTRVLVVTDVARDQADQVAAAYRSLFLAAGGGALGLFTAIERLRRVHDRIASALEAEGLSLLAQHVDAMDPATLVAIFRAEEDACLLGTDALRDGVDVPGRALRLIVFDRVPWPRPDLLHRARRAAFGGRAYDDMMTRLRLKQAYGRLVRREGDGGVFAILDSALPGRLHGAFPEGVIPERVGLAEAVAITRATTRAGE